MKFAIPLAEGKLTDHFGHCQEFALVDVEDNTIKNKETMVPPRHEPGVLPRWLHEQGTNVIIAGGMGARALELFAQNGIKVLTGAPSLTPEELVQQYLDSTLKTGFNMCDHYEIISKMHLASNACANTVAHMAEVRPIKDVWEITAEDVVAYLATLPSESIHCAELAVGAFYLALADWQEIQRHPWKKSYRGP